MPRYCFGAPYVCDELARDTVSAGAFAHPAYLKDQHFENLQRGSLDPELYHWSDLYSTAVHVVLGNRPNFLDRVSE